LRFRREERLGRLARARDPLAITTASVVLLLPVVSKSWPDCLAARDIEGEFTNFGKPLPHLLGGRSASMSRNRRL
jgi:hypothetical protein